MPVSSVSFRRNRSAKSPFDELSIMQLAKIQARTDTCHRKQCVWSVQSKNRAEKSAIRRKVVCRMWASICSFFLLFLDAKPGIWNNNGDCDETEAREAVLWKNIHRYVARYQASHLRARIPLLLHSCWIWSTHKLSGGKQKKKMLSVYNTPAGIQDVCPPSTSRTTFKCLETGQFWGEQAANVRLFVTWFMI